MQLGRDTRKKYLKHESSLVWRCSLGYLSLTSAHNIKRRIFSKKLKFSFRFINYSEIVSQPSLPSRLLHSYKGFSVKSTLPQVFNHILLSVVLLIACGVSNPFYDLHCFFNSLLMLFHILSIFLLHITFKSPFTSCQAISLNNN